MKLLTKEIANRLPPLYSTEDVPTDDKIVQLKFFHPCGRYTFYACEGSAIMPDGSQVPLKNADLKQAEDVIFFGYCLSPFGPGEDEWGNTSLRELESVRGPLGLGIERDLHFRPTKISEVVK
jgi:hypothetical protein